MALSNRTVPDLNAILILQTINCLNFKFAYRAPQGEATGDERILTKLYIRANNERSISVANTKSKSRVHDKFGEKS